VIKKIYTVTKLNEIYMWEKGAVLIK